MYISLSFIVFHDFQSKDSELPDTKQCHLRAMELQIKVNVASA